MPMKKQKFTRVGEAATWICLHIQDVLGYVIIVFDKKCFTQTTYACRKQTWDMKVDKRHREATKRRRVWRQDKG